MSEDKKFKEVLDKAKELENIDFKKVKDFNYDEYYKTIEEIAKKNNTFKNEEAENLIKNDNGVLLNIDFYNELNKKKETILNLIRKYDPNTDIIKNMSEHDVDKVYAISNYLVNSYIQYLNEMTFNFELKVEELKFLNKILTNVIEYNGDDVFNYVELYENFWQHVMTEYESDKSKDVYVFKVIIKKILILHHLIKNYKVRGITNEFKYFRNILYKIAQTNKLFNAYNIIVERVKDDCKLWGIALDEVLSNKQKDNKVEDIKEITDTKQEKKEV